MDTSLKHILKEEFVVYYKNGGGRNYLNTLYSSTVNTTSNVDNAMKLKSLEAAKAAHTLASEIDKDKEWHISKTATIVEDVDINSEED